MDPSSTDAPKRPVVHSVKNALRDLGKLLHRDSGETPSPATAQPQDSLPAYQPEERSNITIDPNISYQTAEDATLLRSLAYRYTGTDGYITYPQPYLAIGPKSRSITLPEREALVQRYLAELESLTAAGPPGSYPPHSAELFKTVELVKTLMVLTDIKEPGVAASKEYLERIKELMAIHERMVSLERELGGRQLEGEALAGV